MLYLTKGKNDDKIVVTLTEKVSTDTPVYLFVFTQITTRDTVKFYKGVSDDISTSKKRYNKFVIDTATLFNPMPDGQYLYRIYETNGGLLNTEDAQYFVLEDGQTGVEIESGSNAIVGLLENGRMVLNKSVAFSYKQYEPETTFKTYAG